VGHLRVSREGVDTFAGGRVFAFVLEFPDALLTANPVFHVWTASYRRTARIRSAEGDEERGPWVQMDRLAVPAVSTGLIVGADAKNRYNRASLNEDNAEVLAATITAVRALATNALEAFNHNRAAGYEENIDPPPGPIISVDALVDLLNPDAVLIDLRSPEEGLTEGLPAFPTFPNGRFPSADVMDTIMSLVLGIPFTDDVATNDCGPSRGFPYLRPPGCGER
jgi:hypothetical protein